MKTKTKNKIILCIDDRPDKYYADSTEGTLEARLRDIYKGTADKYDLVFVATLADYDKILKKDTERRIALVLLDHDLDFDKGCIQGPWIAKDLYKRRPDIKVVGLTIRGRKESTFGHQPNVVDFVSKTELLAKSDYLRHVSDSIIEDYFNKQWRVTWDTAKSLLLLQRGSEAPFECLIGGGHSVDEVLTWALRTPCQWAGPFWQSNITGKATDEINSAVREGTEGRVWGIITSEKAPVRCVKALVNTKLTETVHLPAPVKPVKGSVAWAYEDRLRDMEIQLNKMMEDMNGLKRTFSVSKQSFKDEVAVMHSEIKAALRDLWGGQ